MKCRYFEVCSGCDLIGKTVDEKRERQMGPVAELVRHFEKSGRKTKWVDIADAGLRDRVDLVYTGGEIAKLGLYHKNKSEIVDLAECPQMSTNLSDFYKKVRNISFPIRKGSIRLRVGPRGLKGVWLDFANEDIKNLLHEKTTLLNLSKVCNVIEIGQKRKRWDPASGQLTQSHPEIWFQTYLGDQSLDLACFVGSFTQPGVRANQVLTGEVLALTAQAKLKKIFEFGSGIGNFTLPLVLQGHEVTALEFEASALNLLKLNAERALTPEMQKKLTLKLGNFHKQGQIDFSECEGLVVDPPRSGLGDFLGSLTHQDCKKLNAVVYVSCFPESFLKDVSTLEQLGFKLEALSFVNQFPQTSHIELVSLWRR